MEKIEVLKKRGWVAPSLAFFDSMPMEKVKEVLGSVCDDWGLEDFEDLRVESKRQKLFVDAEDREAIKEPSSSFKDVGWRPGEGHQDLRKSAEGVALEKVRNVLPRMIWPTRYHRRLRHCKDEGQRQKLEEDERDRQIGKLVDLLKGTGLLVGEEDRPAGPAGAWAIKRHALGRRANTLRIHVRLGERMKEYVYRTHGRDWFRNVAEIMDYIAGRLEEPCGKTIPNSIHSTIKFLEMSAELPVDKRMGSDQTLENFINEVNRSQFWAAKPRVSANRWPLAVVICWEYVVMDKAQYSYIRLYAWFKLVKLWGMLRWSDTTGIPAESLKFEGSAGLVGEVVRSKTSGLGRRVEVQHFYVATDSWLLAEGWLKTGFRLFKDLGEKARNSRRDFMMARPTAALDGFKSTMVNYGDAMSMTRALLWELKAPRPGGTKLINIFEEQEAIGFWSEHSERVTMSSWAAALGVKQEVIKRWGRWRPSVDEEYVKTTRVLVSQAQQQVAETLKESGMIKDLLGEDEIMADLKKRMLERGVTEERARSQLKRLRFQLEAYRLEQEGCLSARAQRLQAESPTEIAVEDVDLEELELTSQEAMTTYGLGTYVMSIVGRSKKRTLHVIGGCYRTPGVDYRDFVVVGSERPKLQDGEKLCAVCFSAKEKSAMEAHVEEPEDLEDSASSSSELLSSDPDEEVSDDSPR